MKYSQEKVDIRFSKNCGTLGPKMVKIYLLFFRPLFVRFHHNPVIGELPFRLF